MKKVLKTFYIVLLAILVVVIVAVVAVRLFADRALKVAIETAATRTLNVGVSVGDVDLSILRGQIVFRNLLISNPPGYQYDKLLELKDAQIEVDIKSLLGDVVNIREIKLDGINLVLEQRGLFDNNLHDIMKTISAGSKAEPQKPGKKLHIDNLEISNVTVKVKLLPVPGKVDTITLNLPPIKMTNLGGDDKLDTSGLSAKIFLAISDSVAKEGGNVLPDAIISPLVSQLKGLGALPAGLLEEGGKILKKAPLDLGKGLTEGLEALLKPKKKEE